MNRRCHVSWWPKYANTHSILLWWTHPLALRWFSGTESSRSPASLSDEQMNPVLAILKHLSPMNIQLHEYHPCWYFHSLCWWWMSRLPDAESLYSAACSSTLLGWSCCLGCSSSSCIRFHSSGSSLSCSWMRSSVPFGRRQLAWSGCWSIVDLIGT